MLSAISDMSGFPLNAAGKVLEDSECSHEGIQREGETITGTNQHLAMLNRGCK
jgi:hypothetical protein